MGRRQPDAGARERDRRLAEALPRQAAEPAPELPEPGGKARNGAVAIPTA